MIPVEFRQATDADVAESIASIETVADGGVPNAHLGSESHYCDICDQVFVSVETLGDHDCDSEGML